MAQHDYIIANQSGAAFRADLNNGLAAIVSQNSGAAQPSTTYAYQWWADTTTGLLKIRNAANNAWITVGTLADANLGLLPREGGIILNQGGTSFIEIGTGTNTSQAAYLDFVGDTTYTDYGLRLIRGNAGANASSELRHKGTGDFNIITEEAAPVVIVTNNIERARVGTSEVVFNDDGADVDFRIEGDTNASLFKIDAGLDEVQVANLNGGPLAGFRNRIINGNFDIWQRGTSFTGNEYGADRWIHNRVGTTHTASRQPFTLGQTDVPNEPTYYCRTVVSSVAGASNFSALVQFIEDVRTFAGQQVTVSFWAKVDSTKNITIELQQNFGTGGSPSAPVQGIGSTKVSIGTSWQKITVTATVPSISGKTLGTTVNNYLGLAIFFDAGSDFNARTVSLGQQSGTFDIAQVQIEPGSVATPFEQRPIGTELALCQRYFNRTRSIFRTYQDAGEFLYCYTLPVQMRAQPNTAVLSTAGSTGPTAIAVYGNAYDGQNVNIGVTITGGATFAYAVTEFSASAEL